jgi:virginiamycin A acetyltransferase
MSKLQSKESVRPNPDATHPMTLPNGEIYPRLVYLKNVLTSDFIEIGDYSYYHCFDDEVDDYGAHLAPYLYEISPDKLKIGKFVQIAHGAKFITNSANHQKDGFTSYPFITMGGKWRELYDPVYPSRGDTIVGNDVWIGHEAYIMPGVTVGHGAIIGTRAVVTKDVPPYAIVAGNPAKVVKMRFDDATIAKLLSLAWWDWPIEKIETHMADLVNGNMDLLG